MAGTRETFANIWASGGAIVDPGAGKTTTGFVAEDPPYQWQNWWQRRVDNMLAHIEGQGVADWLGTTVYEPGGLSMGSDNVLYQAVQATTGNNPTTDATNTFWKPLVEPATFALPGISQLADGTEVQLGTDAAKVITPAALVARTAQTNRTGLVELANDEETQALSDSSRAITPAGLGSVQAAEGARGIVQLASAAEVLDGVVASKAVTPAGLASLASSLLQNGYQSHPGGFLLQWGENTGSFGPGTDVALPLAFPNAIFAVVASAPIRAWSAWFAVAGVEKTPASLSQIRLSCVGTETVGWIAVGF